MLTSNKGLRLVREYVIITFGLLLYTLANNMFMLPAKIVGGGVSGIAALIYYATEGGIEVSYSYLAINAVLLIIGFATLGKRFGIKTIYGIVVISLLLKVIPIPEVPHVSNPLMSAIITGILYGSGIGIIFTQGGSAGGTDIVAMIITKYRNMSVGRVFLYCDLIIIGSSYFLHHDLEQVAYGYVLMGISAYCVDMVLSGNKQSVQMFIISRKYDAIADKIITDQKRGVTVLTGMGWYTKKENKILMILARKNETSDIYRIVKEVDSEAFISVANIMGVFGQGFDKIKAPRKIDPKNLLKKRKKTV